MSMDYNTIVNRINEVSKSLDTNDEQVVRIVVSRDIWNHILKTVTTYDKIADCVPFGMTMNGIEIRMDPMLRENTWWPFRRKDIAEWMGAMNNVGLKYKY